MMIFPMEMKNNYFMNKSFRYASIRIDVQKLTD